MGRFYFDWRWIALILFIALLANGRSLPWPIIALALGAGGSYLIMIAWQSSGISGSKRDARVTYWRGQRIETPGTSRRSRPASWRQLAPAIIYTLFGLALLFGAVLMVINRTGL
ncbi:MAG: hypothetical protein HGA19_03355 [Oscillochloris sp.]|nr:hypothetical protein [Oscillochloris sp.]